MEDTERISLTEYSGVRYYINRFSWFILLLSLQGRTMIIVIITFNNIVRAPPVTELIAHRPHFFQLDATN